MFGITVNGSNPVFLNASQLFETQPAFSSFGLQARISDDLLYATSLSGIGIYTGRCRGHAMKYTDHPNSIKQVSAITVWNVLVIMIIEKYTSANGEKNQIYQNICQLHFEFCANI